ncbi:MAG: CRISPR-associated endonuclease Cas2 [Exilispira sp.]
MDKEIYFTNPFDNVEKINTKAFRWVVLYDIRNPKRLKKVAKIMESYGIRVQKSVFEIFAPAEVVQRLRERIQNVISIDDYVLYINVCEEDWQKQIKYGLKSNSYDEKDFFIL